ncbi:MAG: ABC transporter permease [Rhodospirillales bacterium]|nr:ABC transporter permease [Rhodospirillales bacterium]MBT4040203.1 ABC transporter permease [Rhodospirillales bacterium]MBT4628339.1 ABC transporter permease [Rhodospirillales bacterium]MBT5350329.1 ABC transporter permease [Rhodospirillales bacterium]MBT5519911.1 ABC transporter permease [Rhodospirillales bacterium]
MSGREATAAAERRSVRKRWLLVSPALAIIGLVGIMPLAIIAVYSFLSPGPYAGISWDPTLEAWLNVFMERDIFDETLGINYAHASIVTRSFVLAFVTMILALIVGFPTAYFIATRPDKQRYLWLFIISLPFWSNLLVRTFAMMLVLRDNGYINSSLIYLNVIEKPLEIIFTNTAVGIGLTYAYLPLMVMPLYASMEKLDFRLIEAGYDLYGNRWKVLWRIVIPLVRPGIIAGCILVFIPAIGAYVTPKLLGGGKNLMVGNLIANQFGTSRDWPLGSAISLFLMLMVMVALIIYVRNVISEADKNA